uniref:Thioredoxin domain-containing protein n=1 Tax=viral metagenome TaxID=1070528 RepID=A0A6C0LNV8_9ZZZZ
MTYKLEYIGASWCAPCKVVKPKVLEQAAKYSIPVKTYDIDDDVEKIDVDAVKKLPTLRVLEDGKVVAEFTTKHNDQLEEFLSKNIKPATTDMDF